MKHVMDVQDVHVVHTVQDGTDGHAVTERRAMREITDVVVITHSTTTYCVLTGKRR
jgi:hypothetical protein